MKINLTFLFLSVITISAFAAEKPPAPLTVAVYDFKGDVDTKNYGSKVTALVTADLTTEPNLIMLERSELNKALNEQAFGVSGMVSSDAAAKIGQITGVKVLVSGQVIMTKKDHLVIIANIIGTETARLFAAKVEGPAANLVELTTDLSAKIGQTIINQSTNLITGAKESNADRLERIVKSAHGTNRPTVSVGFHHPKGPQQPSFTANTEMGLILQKAGFVVVDGNSERKPDVMITGVVDCSGGPRRGALHTEHAVIEMKVQERRTGLIITMDRQESVAVDAAQVGAQRAAEALAVDELAERCLPLLAK